MRYEVDRADQHQVDEGLHDRISIGCLLQQCADGGLVDPLGAVQGRSP